MDESYVEGIKLYKEIHGKSKHEYLVTKTRAADGTPSFLAFERGRGETIDRPRMISTHPFSVSLVRLAIRLYRLAPWRLHPSLHL